jgi:N-methylhydantoinase A
MPSRPLLCSSWRDGTHERPRPTPCVERCPRYVSISSVVLPQIKEYDRVCTTVVNAYVGPT